MCGYSMLRGGSRFSFTALGLAQRIRFHTDPALSLVPDALAPPNGC